MDTSCFRLERRPFVAAPQLELYFPAPSIETARQTLAGCIQRGAGPGLIIGAAGTGKTLLCAKLASQFRSTAEVAILSNTHACTRRALLQLILFELGLPYRDMDEGEVRLALIGHITSTNHFPHGLVLLVDEAHSLSFKLLEEIRMLSNLVRDGETRVHVVLAGNSVLEERFTSPKLEAFNQRVAARTYLHPLNREETLGYIQSQIALAGGNASDLFAPDACPAIYQATGGIPRLINQLCDRALIIAAANGSFRVEAETVEAAWADLQQLPPPTRSQSTTPGDTVEFGSLQDDDTPANDEHLGWKHDAHGSGFAPALDQQNLDQQDAEMPTDGLLGTHASTPCMDAEQQLEEIARNVDRVRRDMEGGPSDPIDEPLDVQPFDWNAAPRIPSCEDWPLAYDPFAEPFVEEEVVIVDRFSLPEQPAPTYALVSRSPATWEPLATAAGDRAAIGTAVEVIHDDRSPTDIPEQMVSSDQDSRDPADDELQVRAAPTTRVPPRAGRQSQFQRLFATMRTPQTNLRPGKT